MLAVNASLIIDGKQYKLDDQGESPYKRQVVETQPADADEEFERRILNLAIGWGDTKGSSIGTYDYGTAVLHKRGRFLPGATVTDRTPGTVPIGRCTFVEYWEPTAANRRLVVVSPRHIYEVRPDGTPVAINLGATFTAANGMTRGVLFKNPAMSAAKIYVARRGANSTDYMVERTGTETYGVSANNKYAQAVGKGKDSAGDDVVWIVDFNGKLQQATAGSDPSTSGAWAGTTYDIGDTSVKVNDLVQNNRSMVAGREDGAWTFDNVSQSIPITGGFRQTIDEYNFAHIKDFNGMAIAPTVQGLVWMDGLEWGVCGPVSANPEARNLRGREVACTGQLGEYVYCAVEYSGTSYIFLGTVKQQGDMGKGPFTWHGPVATIAESVSDLHGSPTVVGKRLWIGYDGGFASLDLNDDWSPKTDLSAGYIYLPETLFDLGGAGIIKDFRKAEFVASPAAPFASTNAWTLELETTPGSGTYVAIDGGVVNSGVVTDRYWTTETSGKRIRARLAYSGNTGAGELEQVIVRGTMRPETTDEYSFVIEVEDEVRLPAGNRIPKTRVGMLSDLRALVDSGRVATITFGETSFNGRVTSLGEVSRRDSLRRSPVGLVTITVRKVKTSA